MPTDVTALLTSYLEEQGIYLHGVLPLSSCHIFKPWVLSRAGIDADTGYALMFAIPYLTPDSDTKDRNLSAYAVSSDYHLYVRQMALDWLPRLQEKFPGFHFLCSADTSPIDEVAAAVDAGIGVIGMNHLLLTQRHSSYVFIGELLTDLPLCPPPSPLAPEDRHCNRCGRCQRNCPKGEGICLSALTQKKGVLTSEEEQKILTLGSVWGCDICQEVCPYTLRARENGTLYTEIPFFRQTALPHLTLAELDAMTDEELGERAYAWRGRETIRRNLVLFASHRASDTSVKDDKDKESPTCCI